MSIPNTLTSTSTPKWSRRRRRLVATLGLAAVVLGLAASVVLRFTAGGDSRLPVPNPNGYDDLLNASRSITGTPPRFNFQFFQILRPSDGPAVRRLDPMLGNWDEARAYLLANHEVLARARIGLDRESVVPVAFEPGYVYGSNKNREALKTLARLFIWEAQIAVHEGRDADAARSYLDMVRLGHASARGGLEFDAWVGHDIETGGLLGLYRLVKDLDPATCRQTIVAVRSFEPSREPYQAFRDRQAACKVAESGRFRPLIADLINSRAIRQQAVMQDESTVEFIAVTRLVQIELALQVYRSENGSDPNLLDDLVPSILTDIPLDPFTGKAPIYRKTKTGYQLYSVGADRFDDNGAPLRRAPQARSSGDILPDSFPTTLIP